MFTSWFHTTVDALIHENPRQKSRHFESLHSAIYTLRSVLSLTRGRRERSPSASQLSRECELGTHNNCVVHRIPRARFRAHGAYTRMYIYARVKYARRDSAVRVDVAETRCSILIVYHCIYEWMITCRHIRKLHQQRPINDAVVDTHVIRIHISKPIYIEEAHMCMNRYICLYLIPWFVHVCICVPTSDGFKRIEIFIVAVLCNRDHYIIRTYIANHSDLQDFYIIFIIDRWLDPAYN